MLPLIYGMLLLLQLSEQLKDNSSVTSINLSSNAIGDSGVAVSVTPTMAGL